MDKITNAIKCVNCSSIINSPVMLFCGHSVCKHHTQTNNPENVFNLLNQNKITCGKCLKEHTIPSEGFPQNESLIEILAAQIHKIDLGKMHKKAKQDCETIESLVNETEAVLADPTCLTMEEIDTMKNSIFLRREELKLKIDKETDKLITKIDDFLERTKNSVNKKEYKLLNEQNKMAKINLNKNKGKLNEIKVDDTSLTILVYVLIILTIVLMIFMMTKRKYI